MDYRTLRRETYKRLAVMLAEAVVFEIMKLVCLPLLYAAINCGHIDMVIRMNAWTTDLRQRMAELDEMVAEVQRLRELKRLGFRVE